MTLQTTPPLATARATDAPPQSSGTRLIAELESRLSKVMAAVQAEQFWRAVEEEHADAGLALAIMREIFAEVYCYQKRIDEAVFAAVGRFGRVVTEQPLVRSMIAVQIEEVGHGALALHDYVALGGNANELNERRVSPEAFALIAVTDRVSRVEHPLAHLGFMFFFERFTTMITCTVAPLLAKKGYPDERLKFMRLHAEEDVRHADMLANVIVECVDKYPDARTAITYGFDCFAAVYPLPLWRAAYRRALQTFEASDE